MENISSAHFGIIGLGTMGRNLALNVEEHGFPVAVWTRNAEKVAGFIAGNEGRHLIGAKTLEKFAGVLQRPRRILMMVKAGEAVGQTIDKLAPLLDEGDILMDGGNSHFLDTQRREAELKKAGVYFFGVGVSGGEEGARYGPSLMPGGDREQYEHISALFEAIAAKTESGPCVAYMGPGGAGHFAKMVHNGIEYGVMQLIAEAYDIMRNMDKLKPPELAEVFAEWNNGPLGSFLIEITAKIFSVRDDETGKYLIDLVLDRAGNKGTGKWTIQTALDLGVPVPTISAAMTARILSSMKEERFRVSGKIKGPRIRLPVPVPSGGKMVTEVRDSLMASNICVYAQGMSLVFAASKKYNWNINLKEVARIWKGGCIIRATLLDRIMEAYDRQPDLPNLLLDKSLLKTIDLMAPAWRRAIAEAINYGTPVPAMSASLAYFDSYRTADLPQNLVQAQRDAFGAHTYERVDRPEQGFVHTDWLHSDRNEN